MREQLLVAAFLVAALAATLLLLGQQWLSTGSTSPGAPSGASNNYPTVQTRR